MAVLDIVTVENSVLRKKAKPVSKVTKRIQKLLRDMQETMYSADGVGLAAPQIGISQRIIVLDVGEGPISLVNPEIKQAAGSEIDVEGCLSIPNRQGYVKRAREIVVVGMDEKGNQVKYSAEGLFARALQHEIDHLDGILFTDKLEDEEDLEEQDTKKEFS